jgi:phage-related protein (TIGR01555 family)
MSDTSKAEFDSVNDGWENIATGLGMARDKRTGGRIRVSPPNTDYKHFENLYVSDDIAATMAELPAREMVREWINVQTDDSDSDSDAPREAETVEERITAGKRMIQRLEELNAQQAVFEALVWSRVFGGALVLIGADDGKELSEPLEVEKIRSLDSLTVMDRWDVTVAQWDSDIKSKDNLGGSNFNKPLTYRINESVSKDGSQSIEVGEIHHSRFIRFDGPLTTRRRIRDNGGWSDSIYSRIEEVLRDYGTTWAGVAHILQDFAQGVFKIKHLAELLASDTNTTSKVIERLISMDTCRSVARAIPVDADGEDFERKSTPLSGIPETLDRFALRLATAARMPVSLLLGQSPAGLQATGDSDIRFFYDAIKSNQQTQLRPRLEYLLRLLWHSADGPTKGQEPENWSFTFNDLWQLTEEQKADVRKTQAETDALYMQWDVVTPDEIAISRFGGDAYSTDTVLDMETRFEEKLAEMIEPEPEPDPIQIPPTGFAMDPGEPEPATPEGLRGDAAAQPAADVQSLVFSKTFFDRAKARQWAEKLGFRTDTVEETSQSIRLTQRSPAEFETDSFRVANYRGADGVQAVIGKPK